MTQPPTPAFVPPAPHEPTPRPIYGDTFWYGNDKLWTRLPVDGTWRILRDKSFWWRVGHNNVTEPEPPLTLTGRRLDAEAPTFTSDRATSASAADIGMAMLTMVDLPTAGCWEITARYEEATELTFVVWVDPSVP